MAPERIELSPADRCELLTVARVNLVAAVLRHPCPEPGCTGALGRALGAFVTVNSGGRLRGCLGRIEPVDALVRTIASLARAVASSDPRFPPLAAIELPELAIEISVLEPHVEIASPLEIEVGRHGLLVALGGRRGLLLPHVATEHRWDRDTFLEQTCRKAGLPRDAWRRGARLFVFETVMFGETETVPGV